MVNAGSVRTVVVVLILSSIAVHVEPAVGQTRRATSPPAQRTSSPKSLVTRSAPRQLDTRALEVLNSVHDRLARAHTLSFVGVDTSENRTDADSPRIQRNRVEVTLKRPDKARVVLSGDAGVRSQVNCNGRTMLTYKPAAKAIAIAKAPPAIVDCLKEAYRAAAIDFPVVDLILASPSIDLAAGLKRAHYIGQSLFGGTNTDVISLTRDGVVAQVWVGTEDKLPRAIRVDSVDDPNRSRRTLTLSDWQIDVAVAPDAFASLQGLGPDHTDALLPGPVGTSGIQSVPRERPLTLHTYSSKYWGGGGGSVPLTPYAPPGYYQSPDGYGYYPSQGYAFPPATDGYYEEPCFDCGEDWPEGAPVPGFNLALSTFGWYPPQVPVEQHLSTDPFWPGQIVSRLPVGCAATYPGPAFYLCGDTWFAGIVDADGNRYYRVIGGTGY